METQTFAPCFFKVTTSELGGFVSGDTVVAARDLRVRGKVVVRQAMGREVRRIRNGRSDRLSLRFGDKHVIITCLPNYIRWHKI